MDPVDQDRVVLLIDHDLARRQALGRGLAEVGYEVVQTVDAAEGRRFRQALGVALVVAELKTLGGAAQAATLLTDPDVTVLLLTDDEDLDETLPAQARRLPLQDDDRLVEQVRLMLLGRELDLEADLELNGLVGELHQHPFLAITLKLSATRFSGTWELPRGQVRWRDGAMIGASDGIHSDHKAFCRLGAQVAGSFRVVPQPPTVPAADRTSQGLRGDALVDLVIDDQIGRRPAGNRRLRMQVTGAASGALPLDAVMLAATQAGATVQETLDANPLRDGQVLDLLSALEQQGWLEIEPEQRRVVVVTDSTADLPSDVAEAHGIHIVPLHVDFGRRSFRDGIDLTNARFYDMLESSATSPSTRPPAAAIFRQQFDALDASSPILSIHISSLLSETSVNATAARARDDRIQVLDSRQVSLPLGLLSLFAARMAQRELAIDDIVARLDVISKRMHSLFVVDSLDYLMRGGRIGKARGWLGKLLGIKPILGIDGGEVVPVARVRGGRAAQRQMVDLLQERVGTSRVVVGIVHARAPVWADRLRTLIEERFDVLEIVPSEMGPVVGTHTGKGTVGAVLFAPTDDEWPLLQHL